jgi:hypothetical protein
VGGESTCCCCCFDIVLLLLIVVVDVNGTVFCETIAEYWRTGKFVVDTGYVKCGGALVESIDGTIGKINFEDGDWCCNIEGVLGEDTCDIFGVEGLFVPELDLDKRRIEKVLDK